MKDDRNWQPTQPTEPTSFVATSDLHDLAMEASRECFDRYDHTMRELAASEADFDAQMAGAREVMRKNSNALRKLAKN